MATITTDGAVWTLNLGDDENRFTPAFLDEVESGLDKLEASDEPAVLVTIGTGKFFSNGLDLQSLGLQFEGRAATSNESRHSSPGSSRSRFPRSRR